MQTTLPPPVPIHDLVDPKIIDLILRRTSLLLVTFIIGFPSES
ncbi:MAG: hypothetical protein ACJ8FY_22120 [Gemmataceae bacterium]